MLTEGCIEDYLDEINFMWESGAGIEKTGDTQGDTIIAKMREIGREGVKQKLVDAKRRSERQLQAFLATEK